MSESVETESKDIAEQNNNGKRKIQRKVNEGCNPAVERPLKKTCVSFTKPSYIPRLNNVRTENCGRITHLTGKLMRQHNWKEASGTLSVALKGTCKETSPVKNRIKYTAVMELLKRLDNNHLSLAKIKHIYEIWMRKNRSMKNWRAKDRYVIQLEFVLFCLTQGNIKEAHQAVICLMQESEYGSDPTLNMMVGLIFYQLWYSTIQKDMRLRDSDRSDSPTTLEIFRTWSVDPVEDSDCHKAADMHEENSPAQCDSETSIRIDKKISVDSCNPQKKKSRQNIQPQGFYMEESAEQNANDEAPFSYRDDNLMHESIFFARGLDTSLLPIRFPRSHENWEEFMHLHRQLLNDHYASAVKHLRVALYSAPPELAALLPLIQLLLVGDRVNEAMSELERLCHNTNMTLPFRLRASIAECFDLKQYDVLSTCYEDILKKDPTCIHSLRKLITMHNNGDYNFEPLVEMIALHLDATYATCDIWGELASCFLKLSHYEEDQMSVCGNENEYGNKKQFSVCFNSIPRSFIEGNLRMSWKLRCKWWSRRHFSKNIHDSEMQEGEFQLLTCKAACACHLYGPEFEYVKSVNTYLKKEDNQERMMFLQNHMNNSIKLLENLNRSG
ncbi:uncharacterized protein LOC122651738 isoform X2 [Telopea speciosissima]|uniref:uncharacterized protein LOC122651738 isoform X2 n=1 Tax=Telopea speciosissima TaxID=54955 RepID=UPI001CC4E517|nr:uncharacterized protein LOC122651738 isoform X2 [Telopea speciosissima]